MTKLRTSGALFVVAVSTAFGLGPAPRALAAEVGVRETHGDAETAAVLEFNAAAGEDNSLTIKTVSKSAGFLRLEVKDEGAAVKPGPGCVGGGSGGVPVDCEIHEAAPPECGEPFKACPPVPGTGWFDSMSIQLGDGQDSFDAGSFTKAFSYESVPMEVLGGAGDDRILTGGGNDTIEAGPGSDLVETGAGEDTALAGSAPDGSDVYDLGLNFDEVTYSSRTQPIGFRAKTKTAGGEGESDVLHGVEHLVGGSADDSLIGTGWISYHVLEGGPGDDVLAGGSAAEEIVGGPGDDLLLGGAGKDALKGGKGSDRIYGGAGADGALGGSGHDALIGGRGFDHLYGGAGRDRLYGGPPDPHANNASTVALDDGPDMNDCGPGRDTVIVAPDDSQRRCEIVRTVRGRTDPAR